MSARRSAALIMVAVLTIALAAIGSLAARQTRPEVSLPVESTLPDTLSFPVEYAGIGAEGMDMIWRGRVAGPVAGQVTIRMEYAGAATDRGMPMWPVNAWFFFSADDYRSSFAAELSGSMNWRTGDLRVTGLVSDGHRINAPVEQRMRVRPPGLAGAARVIFLTRLAARPGILRAASRD